MLFYLAKAIMKNTDFKVHFLRSDVVESDIAMGSSVSNAKRNRLQVEVIIKF